MPEYVDRTYRLLHSQKDLAYFRVLIKETDLDIGVSRDKLTVALIKETNNEVMSVRSQLEQYIRRDELFLRTLKPHQPARDAPKIVRVMAEAGAVAGTGPMAAVAGAIAQHVGEYLAKRSREVIVENGGDIYIRSGRVRKIGIFAGESPFTNRVALEIQPHQTPLGVCTSSGTVGHSLSLGRADAVVILAPSAPLADAVATAAGNLVQDERDLEKAVNFALGIKSVTGALAIKNDQLAAAGKIKLVPM